VKTGLILGLGALLLQPFTGLFYAFTIRQAAPEAYEQIVRGPYQFLAYAQFTLVGLMILGNHLLLHSASPRGERSRWLDVAIPTGVVIMIGSVGHTDLRRSALYALVALTFWSVWSSVKPSQGRAILFGEGFGSWARSLAMMLGVLSVLTYLTMGTIRETARRPDTVRNLISLHDEAAHPAAFREEGPKGKPGDVYFNREGRQ